MGNQNAYCSACGCTDDQEVSTTNEENTDVKGPFKQSTQARNAGNVFDNYNRGSDEANYFD